MGKQYIKKIVLFIKSVIEAYKLSRLKFKFNKQSRIL
jgi:hypothetical protein